MSEIEIYCNFENYEGADPNRLDFSPNLLKFNWMHPRPWRFSLLARRATALPATTPPAALAAGDLDGLSPVATRPWRRQAAATMTAMPRRPK